MGAELLETWESQVRVGSLVQVSVGALPGGLRRWRSGAVTDGFVRAAAGRGVAAECLEGADFGDATGALRRY